MVSSINKGYFGIRETQNFIKNINNKDNLHIRLKSLSSDEREFIELACKVAEAGKGRWTSWLGLPESDYRMLVEGGESSGKIWNRFTDIEAKISTAPIRRERSNFFIRILKGLGNFLGRISSQSLANKITSLHFN